MTEPALPIKKTVALAWRGRELSFDVAQELFSSHQVDRGSRLLLDSLDPEVFPDQGVAADFGCGYGVLGIAWQAVKPEWSMSYIDRDALAVAFSRHNVFRLLDGIAGNASYHTAVSLPYRCSGHDLVLWNVPGKAGRDAIAGLLEAVVDQLAVGGVLAAVVVHPLAEVFTEQLERGDATVSRIERGREHTVVHIRRERGEVVQRHPFEEGIFDRPPQRFEVDGLAWTLMPVIGLPEYDSLDHATQLAVRAMISADDVSAVRRWLVVEPGVGHIPVAASMRWPGARGEVRGRDMLGILSTRRALGAQAGMSAEPVWGWDDLSIGTPVDFATVALPEQVRNDDLERLLARLSACVAHDGTAVFHGRSTEVARLQRVMRRDAAWRAARPVKLRGAACMTARHRAGLDVTPENA